MFDEKMMLALEKLSEGITTLEDIDSYTFARCDCTGGCTDNCYDCSENSGNQW